LAFSLNEEEAHRPIQLLHSPLVFHDPFHPPPTPYLVDGLPLLAVPAQRRGGHGAAEDGAGGGDGRGRGNGGELKVAAPAFSCCS